MAIYPVTVIVIYILSVYNVIKVDDRGCREQQFSFIQGWSTWTSGKQWCLGMVVVGSGGIE